MSINIYKKIIREYERQNKSIQLIASENLPSPSVLKIMRNVLLDYKTAEGYIGNRYHSGCAIVDEIEAIGIQKAKELFHCSYANIQPNSATIANQAALGALAYKNAKILSMDISCGGHISHRLRFYSMNYYKVDPNTNLLDYSEIRKIAKKLNPTIIIAGSSSYPRKIDFKQFRLIAEEVGAYLIADIAHIAGIICSTYHNSPINEAHIVTGSTYKTFRGPRSGFIIIGNECNNIVNGKKISSLVDKSLFPYTQSSPNMLDIAGKSMCFSESNSNKFKIYIAKVLENSKVLAEQLVKKGLEVVTNGTDNHIVLLNLKKEKISGYNAEKILQEVGILVNRNQIPFDNLPPLKSSGIRIGTSFITSRGLGKKEMVVIADLVYRTINAITSNDGENYKLNIREIKRVKEEAGYLIEKYPLENIYTLA